jgi:hypothetical protein
LVTCSVTVAGSGPSPSDDRHNGRAGKRQGLIFVRVERVGQVVERRHVDGVDAEREGLAVALGAAGAERALIGGVERQSDETVEIGWRRDHDAGERGVDRRRLSA